MEDRQKLIDRCRHFVLDMDGTFYLGNTIIEGSLEFLSKLVSTGRDFIFFTNNSSKSSEVYIEKLATMDCIINSSQIMTSGDVTIQYLNTYYSEKPVYLVGTRALRESFLKGGINLVENDAEIVVVGFDTTLTYEKLVKACDYVRNGAVYLATHLDINCPVENGFIPDVGSFCALISKSTGKSLPKSLGKPSRETVDSIVAKTGWKREEIAFVGDRIYTDVATGVNNGSIGLLVLSGESDIETVRNSDVKPDGVFKDLKEISTYL